MLQLILAVLVVLVSVAAVALTWLVGTESGLRFALARAPATLPLEFDPAAAEGSLVGPMRLPRASWAEGGYRVELRGLELDWSPTALLRRQLQLDLLRAEQVVVELPPDDGAALEPGRPAPGAPLPWPLTVGELRVGALGVSRAGTGLVEGLEIGLAGTLDGDRLALDRLRLSHPRLALEGSARLALDPAAPLEAAFAWRAPYEGHDWSGRVSLAGPLDDLELDLSVGTPLTATVTGRLRGLPADPNWELAANIEPLPGKGPWPPELDGVAARLDFSGRLVERGFTGRVEDLVARLERSRIEGGGTVGWEDGLALQLALTAHDFDPGRWLSSWPGRLDGRLMIDTPAAEPGVYHLQLESVAGQLRGYALEGAAEAWLDPAGSARGNVRLELDGSRVSLRGRADRDALELDAELVTSDLGTLLHGSSGSLAAHARIMGAPAAPAITLHAEGRGLAWNGLRGRVAELQAELDLSGEQPSALQLEIAGVGQRVGRRSRVQLVGTGTPAAHELRLEFHRQRPEQGLSMALAGSFTDQRWLGRLEEALISEAEQPLWVLQEPAPAALKDGEFSLRDACLDGVFGLLCLDGAIARAGPWQAEAALAGLDLAEVGEWLNLGLQAAGTLTGGISVSADQARFTTLSGGLGLGPGQVRVRGETNEPLLAWSGGALELAGDAGRASGALRLLLAGEDHLEAELGIGWNHTDPPLDGSLTGQVSQLGLIRELVPELGGLGGRMELDGRVSGTLGDPAARLAFRLREGNAYLPGLGIRPEDIELDALLEQDMLRFRLTGRSGDGRFEGHGEFDLEADGLAGSAFLEGDSVLVVDLPDVRVAASPDLDFRYAPGRLAVTGSVTLPAATIRGFNGGQAITPSADAVIVGPAAPEGQDELEVRSRIRLVVGPAVEIQASGFAGRVEGELLTVIAPDADPWGRGELRVQDGSFAVFGQRLDISSGRLIYDGGPLENPSLEIRAEREIDFTTAGALVRGTLDQPEISLYSDPPMPRAEILAYLALGKGVDELDTAEQGSVNQAANALALSGGSLVVQDLARRLGFEGLSVSARSGPDETALVVSKYLGSGLYVSYGVGLFDTVNTLRLRYQVNRRLSLEATSGEEEAAEAYYTFERD
nr:translocation/assembly module TamB domain-containing protein [Thioalkalivibrio sp. XN8]